MDIKNIIKDNKRGIILMAAVLLPFGITALGMWKAIELYRERKKNGSIKNHEPLDSTIVDNIVNGSIKSSTSIQKSAEAVQRFEHYQNLEGRDKTEV